MASCERAVRSRLVISCSLVISNCTMGDLQRNFSKIFQFKYLVWKQISHMSQLIHFPPQQLNKQLCGHQTPFTRIAERTYIGKSHETYDFLWDPWDFVVLHETLRLYDTSWDVLDTLWYFDVSWDFMILCDTFSSLWDFMRLHDTQPFFWCI